MNGAALARSVVVLENRMSYSADDVHFAGFAVKSQGQFVSAVDQCERFCLDGALHTRDAFGLFGAQAQ